MEISPRIKNLLELLKEESSDLFLNYALGLEYQSNKMFEKAEIQFKKVLSLDADYIAAYYQLGKLLETELKLAEALVYFKMGLEKAKIKKDFKAINELGEAIFMLED